MDRDRVGFERGLLGWADGVSRRARLIVGGNLILSLLLAAYTFFHLGVNADNMRLLNPNLPFQQAAASFQEDFLSLDDALLVVIDARSGALAQESSDLLVAALAAQPELFHSVFEPGSGGFFEQNGLLYRTPEDLEEFADKMALYQPILAELSRTPTLANLASMLQKGFDEGASAPAASAEFARILDRIGQASTEVFAEYPVAISWQDLMMEGSAIDPGTRRVVIVEPILDFGAILAAAPAMKAIRQTAQTLGLTPAHGVVLRITGNPALNAEEMTGLFWDVGISGIFSFLTVLLAIFIAFRSLRLALAAGATLLTGLIWTAAFAAFTVGALNLISIAFAVLFIGLGVDFAIHLGMHMVAALRSGASVSEALREAGSEVGGSLILCTFTTAIGFYSFVPTDYLGVAELGLISGTGMFVIFVQTAFFFPALARLLLGTDGAALSRTGVPFQFRVPVAITARPKTVVAVTLLLGIFSAGIAPQARFDSDVVEIRDPRTESVQAFKDLLEDPRTSPWYIDAVAPNLAAAEILAQRFAELPEVSEAITVNAYVPDEQLDKIEILADTAMLFDLPEVPQQVPTEVSASAQIQSIQDLQKLLRESPVVLGDSTLSRAAARLDGMLEDFLRRVRGSTDSGPIIQRFEDLLLGSFPEQFSRLQAALEPMEIRLDNLPFQLRRRMLAPDGKARVQVFSQENLGEGDARESFVDAIRTIQPDATGVAVNLIEFGRATARSLVQALSLAFVLITILLISIWRRPLDTALVLLPLLTAGVVTGAVMVVLDQSFNFANVIVLPLLLGIGVDSGVHLVHRAREEGPGAPLLASVTAQAVFWSALTTIVSFGSLALSAHRGIASLGVLLVVGLLITMLANLILLPALVVLLQRRGYLLSLTTDSE